MAILEKPTLVMRFTGDEKTIDLTFDNVRTVPNADKIKAGAAVFNNKFEDDPTATFVQGYYRVDSLVASADD